MAASPTFDHVTLFILGLKYSRDSHETAPMKTPLTCLDLLLTGYVPGLPACIVERKIVPTTQLEVK